MLSPKEYYDSISIQQRLAEYCGGQTIDPSTFTTEYLSGVGESFKSDRVSEEYYFIPSRRSFLKLLDSGVDIFRAVWDRSSTLGILDIEYFNLDYPAEAYFNPHRTFYLLEDICQRIEKIFRRFGIPYLQIMTGQGYHYSFRVSHDGKAHNQLAALGNVNDSLALKYASPKGRLPHSVPAQSARAFDAMGRLMEYVSHMVLSDMSTRTRGIPVVCTDLSPGNVSREAISIDLSMYGDPVYMRDIRCPFSTYQKHRYQKEKFGERAAGEIPPLAALPRSTKYTLDDLIGIRADLGLSQDYARHAGARIPEASAGIQALIKSYISSRLFRFHSYFDSQQHDSPALWPKTYDSFDPNTLPCCVAHCLQWPNDNLLKPTNLQALTRVLLKIGWHPRHIAGLVRSRLEKDFGLGSQWQMYDASVRADFYVRMFAGLIAAGIDTEADLDCLAHAEKGYCWKPHCGQSLADYRLN